jgi:class 3 adenylate cyclase/tetratricopeptide (TPR) repeat protein
LDSAAGGNTALDHLQPYVSPAFRRMVASHGDAPLSAAADTFEAVALFADMSGFSTLTASLSMRGLQGAETLSTILNVRFGRLVDLVHQYGGLILDFAGDAAVAYWPILDDPSGAARRAVACGHAMNEVVAGSGHGGQENQLRVGVGAGQVLCALLGGVDGRWHSLMGGAAWTDMLQAVVRARPGEVVLAPSVERLITSANPVALGVPPASADPELPAGLLRAAIPRSVQKRVDAGQQGWLAEFRTVSTVFVNVRGLHYDTTARLPELQRIAETMQSVVHRFGGSVNDLVVDDKGTVLLAVWGIPLHAYEDNAVRATLAGMTLRDELRALGVSPAIGITTGRAFAGPVGNQRRMRYGLFGEPIILAARLMQAAGDEVLCDSATRTAARARVRFGEPAPARVPGRGEVGIAAAALDAVDSRVRPSREMVGREREARTLGELFTTVERDGENRLIVVRGEPGIGKSTLISSLLQRALGSPMRVMVGTGESMASTSPYHAWRAVFEGLGVHGELMAAGRDASAEATRDYLAEQFHRARGTAPMALVLEDAHWMDSASWSLAAEIQRTSERLLLVIVTRPMAESDTGDDCKRLLSHPDAQIMDLDLLARADAVTLACRRLDVDSLPPAVADLIAKIAEGHPLFTEQLVRTLLERGVIRVEDHRCTARPDLALPEFPNTVEGLIRSRIDLLDPEEQFTLKIASVFGRIVDVQALLDVHPLRSSHSIEPQLRNMAHLGLLDIDEDAEAADVVAFKHGLIQEVAYATLSFEQRRRLHHAAGEWYERTNADASDVFPLLARHWSEAGVVTKSLFYLERAGTQALRTGNYRETLAFLDQAMASATKAPKDLVPPSRSGVWLRQLGQAYYSLGRLDEAREHLERATDTLGYPVPQTQFRQGVAVARGALSPWLSRASGQAKLDPKSDATARDIYEAATALDAVSAIYYLNGDTLRTAYCLARRFELLARLVPTDLFARCSAEMAFLWEYAGIRRQADRLFDQGWQMANALQAPLTSARILYSWSVFDLGRGNWASVNQRARASTDIYRQLNENRLRRDSEFIDAYCETFTGAYASADAAYQRLQAESTQQEAVLHLAWAGVGLGKIARRRGAFAAGQAWIDQGLDAARKSGDRVSVLMLLGLRASVRAHTGDTAGATDDLRTATPQIAASSPAVMTIDAWAAIAEAALTLLAKDRSPEIDKAATMACASLRKATKVFVTAKPAAWLWTGVLHERHGKLRKAERCWREALAAAERLSLPFEEGLIRLQLGRTAKGADERNAHLGRARDLFQRLDATHELRRVEEAAKTSAARRS